MKSLLCLAAFFATGFFAAFTPLTAAEGGAPSLAVLPMEIQDNSGELGAARRLDASMQRLTRYVRQEIAKAGLYEIVPDAAVDKAMAEAKLGTWLHYCNNCEPAIGRAAGAERVMVAWIYKVSRLILQLHVQMKDTASGAVVYRQDFDFRGDNDKAFQRAADYMIGALAEKTEGQR